MRRLMIATALTASFLVAGPVAAAQPQRGCPRSFTETTEDALIATWSQFDEAEFRTFLEPLDANDNDELCFLPFPENSHIFGEPFFVGNFIDDVSNASH